MSLKYFFCHKLCAEYPHGTHKIVIMKRNNIFCLSVKLNMKKNDKTRLIQNHNKRTKIKKQIQ